ncbi:unnamed protein product [Malus baccata var. baccata]
MRHQSIVELSAIEAESFKALKLEPSSDDELRRVRGPSLPKTCCSASRGNYRNVSVFVSGAAFDGVSDLGSRHFCSSIFESSWAFVSINGFRHPRVSASTCLPWYSGKYRGRGVSHLLQQNAPPLPRPFPPTSSPPPSDGQPVSPHHVQSTKPSIQPPSIDPTS